METTIVMAWYTLFNLLPFTLPFECIYARQAFFKLTTTLVHKNVDIGGVFPPVGLVCLLSWLRHGWRVVGQVSLCLGVVQRLMQQEHWLQAAVPLMSV